MSNRSLIDEISSFNVFWEPFAAKHTYYSVLERQLALAVWLARSIDEDRDLQTVQLVSKIASQGVKNDERRR